MPIEIEEKIQGRSIVVHISGMLSKADYPDFVSEFDRLVRLSGKQRVLFDLTGLEGWDLGAAWADTKFGLSHFSDIERLAMVGDKKWEQFMSFLLKPFTGAKTRYFDHADAAQARKWLEEGPTAPAPTAANV
jgi:hypothetical protein